MRRTACSASTYRGLEAIGIDLTAADRRDPELKALRQLKKRIGVKRSDKAFVVDVFVTTETREKSVRLADAVAQSYLDDQAEARAAASGRASSALGGRLEALRAKVQEAEDRVVQYREEHKILAAGGILVNEQQLSEMNVQLNASRGKVAEARARYEQITRARRAGAEGGAIPEAVLSQTIGQLRTQYAEVARQRAELGALVGPRHPSIVNLDAQIQGVQKLINEELGRIAAAARSELERAQASEQALEADLEKLKQTAVSTNQASVRLRELDREVEASRAVYQAFLTRARETGEQRSIDNTNARDHLERDAAARQELAAAAAAAGGRADGRARHRHRRRADARIFRRARLLARPAAGPHRRSGNRRAPRAEAARQPLEHAGGLGARAAARTGDDGGSQTETLIAAMRRLRDALFDGGKPPRGHSLLVASATPGEGRTTVALNLALTAAAEGWRVLLVDADINRAMLSKTLDAAGNAGLLDLIEGRATLASVLLNDTDTGLNFLPLGNATRSESRMPVAQELAQKLADQNFDLTIIDSGAMLDGRLHAAVRGAGRRSAAGRPRGRSEEGRDPGRARCAAAERPQGARRRADLRRRERGVSLGP